jgi:hypothetical protein
MLTEIDSLVDECTDLSSFEIARPENAVRLVNHPEIASRNKIFDKTHLTRWLAEHLIGERSEDYHHATLTCVLMEGQSVDQKQQASAARIQTIAMVALYNEIVLVGNMVGIVGINRIIEILEMLKTPEMSGINELGELLERTRSSEYLDLHLILTEILECNQIPSLSLAQAFDKIHRNALILLLEQYVEQAMIQTLGDSKGSNIIQVLSWVDCLPEVAIAQANADLMQIIQGAKSLAPIVDPAPGVFGEGVGETSINWLKSRRVHESLFSSQEKRQIPNNEDAASQAERHKRALESQKRREERIKRALAREAEQRIHRERLLAEKSEKPIGELHQLNLDRLRHKVRLAVSPQDGQRSAAKANSY